MILLTQIYFEIESSSDSAGFIFLSYYVIEFLANFFRLKFFMFDFEFLWFPKKCIKKHKLLSNAHRSFTQSNSKLSIASNSTSNSNSKSTSNMTNNKNTEIDEDVFEIKHELEHFFQRKPYIYTALMVTLVAVTALLIQRLITRNSV